MLVGDCPKAGATSVGPPPREQSTTISTAESAALTHKAVNSARFAPVLGMDTLTRPYTQLRRISPAIVTVPYRTLAARRDATAGRGEAQSFLLPLYLRGRIEVGVLRQWL